MGRTGSSKKREGRLRKTANLPRFVPVALDRDMWRIVLGDLYVVV